MRSKRLRLLALGGVAVVVLVVVLAVALSGGEDAAGDRDSVTIAIAGEPSSFDVSLVEDGNMQSISRNVFEGLTGRAPDMEVRPELATSWEQTSEDTWTFELREGVTFHNGEPFDAEAAEFSIQRILDPANESPLTSFLVTVESAEATGPNTLEITTKGPDPNLPGVLSYVMMVPPGYVNEDAERFARRPVGTGPYRLQRWVAGRSITLAANEDYWGEAPEIDRATVIFRPESQVRLAALRAGEAQVAPVDPAQAEQAPKLTTAPSTDVSELGFDALEGRPLADERLRMAINLAIDREQLIEFVFKGHARPANGQIVPEAAIGYNEDLQDYPFDLERARGLVREAGAEGQRLVLVASQGRWPEDVETVQALAGMIEETGLRVEVETLEFSRFLERVFDRDARADLMYFAASSDTFDSSRAISTLLLSPEAGGTLTRYSNPRIDGLLEQALEAGTLEEKEELYHELWQVAYDEAAVMPVVGLENVYGTSEDIEWQGRPDNRINVAEMSFG